MPTSAAHNLVYRLALPVLAPAVPRRPIAAESGRPCGNREALCSVLRRHHISGAAIRLQSGEEYCDLYSRAVHTGLVPDEHTFFRVASVTKMATALLSVRLMDEGLLDPDAPVSGLLPEGEKVPELKGIRFRHLLSHTSGLSDPPGLEEMLNRQAPYPKAVAGRRLHSPGEYFLYSNLGYGLAGCVLENLLNEPLGRIFRTLLFDPLQMNATLEGCSLPEKQIMPVIRILPYRSGSGFCVTPLGKKPLDSPDPMIHYGHSAGSMYTDLPSLAKLLRCIRDGGRPLLSPQYADYMKKEVSQYGKLSPTLSYGSGLLIIRDPRISPHTVYGHQGFAYGCVDGAVWEEDTGRMLISLNGGCSEARTGRLGIANLELCRFAFRKEMPRWK